MNDRSSPSGSRRSKRVVHPALAVALIAVFGFLLWVTLNDPVRHHQMSVETSLREAIYLTALALDAEREATGSYPPTLESIAMDEEGVSYALADDGYLLVAEEEGVTVEYRSGEDLTPFRAAFRQLLPPHLRIDG